jgi:hypothetical protein
MEDQPQKKVSPIWHSDIPGMLGFLIVPLVAILAGMFFPFVSHLTRHGSLPVYIVAVLAGVVGVVLLFFARLPLYRQRQFFTFGSRHLDTAHRRLYRLAYFLVWVSGILLFALFLAVGL